MSFLELSTCRVSLPNPSHALQLKDLLPELATCQLFTLHKELEPRRQKLLALRRKYESLQSAGKNIPHLAVHPGTLTSWQVGPYAKDVLQGVVIGAESAPYEKAGNWQRAPKNSWNGGTFLGRTVKVRGIEKTDGNIQIDGEPLSAALFDCAVNAYHTAREILARNLSPIYSLEGIEHSLEARWWNQMFTLIEKYVGLEENSLRVIMSLGPILGHSEGEEILYELKGRAVAITSPKDGTDCKSLIDICKKRGALLI